MVGGQGDDHPPFATKKHPLKKSKSAEKFRGGGEGIHVTFSELN
jgi:hypothetical protein